MTRNAQETRPEGSTLEKVGGEPQKWSLKTEWLQFNQLYFGTEFRTNVMNVWNLPNVPKHDLFTVQSQFNGHVPISENRLTRGIFENEKESR